jgi:hypothetical protein
VTAEKEVRAVIYNTEVFEVTDAGRFKGVLDQLRASVEAVDGSDVRVFRNVDNPNQVFLAMWWPSAETCRTWAAEHTDEFMKAAEGVVTSMEPEFLWEEY